MGVERYGPRERMAETGAVSLHDLELLQVLIGSGTVQHGVAKIARRVKRVLVYSGSSVTVNELIAIPGMGIVRASQIVAAFELASRYPPKTTQVSIKDERALLDICTELRHSVQRRCMVITLDGAYRYISKRTYVVTDATEQTFSLRQILADIIHDGASRVHIVFGARERELDPTLDELMFMRDFRRVAEVLRLTTTTFYLLNAIGERTLGSGA